MLDTTRAIGAGELSLATPAACTAASPSSAAAAAVLHGSPVESEGTEFFDAYDTLPWSPERAVPTRQSPAAVAARRMQLALWPDTEDLAELAVAEKPRQDWEVFNGINSSAPNVVEPKGAMPIKTASLSSLFPSKDASWLQPQGWKVIDSDVRTGAAAVSNSTRSSPRLHKPGVAPHDRNGGPAAVPLPGAEAEANRRRRERERATTAESSTRSYSRSSDSGEEDIDDSSTTVSGTGTTVTEEGWGSGPGSDGEGAVATGLALRGKGNETQATAAPSKRTSLRRVLDSARTLHMHRERSLRKMMSMGTRRRAHTVATATAAAVATSESVSPVLDSGATSPDAAVPAGERTARSSTEATASEAAATAAKLGASPRAHPADKCDSCTESRANSNVRRSCSYKFRRGGKAKGGGGGDGGGSRNRPPEVHIKQHGRGGGKEKAWKSMQLVQSLKYHEGPIWTLKFNVHGTRMATAGQDGKVIIWDVAVPPRGGSPATAAEGAADGTDTSNSSGGASRRRGRNSTATLPSPGGGTAAVDVGGASYQGAGAKSAAAVAVKHAPEGGAGREEAYLDTESTSTALSDDGSRGRGSSELGLAGGDRDGKEQGFAGSEVFAWTPVRVFEGHKSDVVDLSWSHSDFLCSASIDHTVMLWHPHREERLGKFTHPDFVTSVHFHPLDDHIFLTGCFDKRLRLWKIPDGRVVDWVQCQDMVSAASFSPDGQLAVAGLYNGRVMFYHTTGLRYYTQIHCRNRHGSKRRGKKVTGLDFVETTRLQHAACARHPGADGANPAEGLGAGAECGVEGGDAVATAAAVGAGVMEARQRQQQSRGGKADSMSSQYSLLTTTNDSRLRIYDLDHFSMTCKLKGLVNDGIQIKAKFSEDGMLVVSGSEDGQVYLWNSKQHRQRASRSSVGSAGSNGVGVGVGVGVGAAAGSSCPLSNAAAAAAVAAPAPTPATRVKSRTSSSFSVQCATTPKVATVAVFFPPAALDAVCQAAAGAGSAAADAASVGGDNPGTGAGIAKGWRGSLHRSPSSPPEAKGGDGPHGEAGVNSGGDCGGGGPVQAMRRRWSFAGQARFGSKTQPQHATHSTGKGASCSSPPSSGHRVEIRTTGNSAQLPEEGSTLGESTEAEAAAAAIDAAGNGPAHPSVRGWGNDVRRYRARGGAVQAIVSADYNGEIKVFVGFAGGLEGFR